MENVIELKRKAEADDLEAMYQLAECYYNGLGTEQSKYNAMKWYQKAAKKGYADAQYKLGYCYLYDKFGSKTDAFKWLLKAVEQENIAAKVELALCYDKGIGTGKNEELSLVYMINTFAYMYKNNINNDLLYGKMYDYFYNKAQNNHALSQFVLSCFHYDGIFVDADHKKGFEWLKKAAENNYSVAYCLLGCSYFNGDGVDKDCGEAIKWFRKSAGQGDIVGQFRLGDCYFQGKGVDQSYDKAIYWLEKSANQGNAEAQLYLADCYYSGLGVKQNYENAAKWLRKSAEQGNMKAQNNLGNCYFYGNGVEQSYDKAIYWFENAANRGEYNPIHNLGACCYESIDNKNNYNRALDCLLKLANQGNSYAQNELAEIYFYGIGIEKNLQKAFEWFEKSANQGNFYALNELGVCYLNGEGVEQDHDKAFCSFKRASEQNIINGLNNLGICYYNGFGTTQDYSKAFECFKTCVEKMGGNSTSWNNLAGCYLLGNGVEKDYNKAFEYYKKAAEAGSDISQYQLGFCYFFGKGVKKNDEESFKWYKKSAEQGLLQAKIKLAVFYYKGIGTIENKEKTIELFEDSKIHDNEAVQYFIEKLKIKQKIDDSSINQYIEGSKQGVSEAQMKLGYCYEFGKGVIKDKAKAYELYKKAAEQENSEAQYRLACYFENENSSENKNKVVYWMEKSAENNYPEAQFKLGQFYYTGTYVDKNIEKAIDYFELASNDFNENAMYMLGDVYDARNDKFGAFAYYQNSAIFDKWESQRKVAERYEFGEGTEKDLSKAIKWLKIANDNTRAQLQESVKAYKEVEKQLETLQNEMFSIRSWARKVLKLNDESFNSDDIAYDKKWAEFQYKILELVDKTNNERIRKSGSEEFDKIKKILLKEYRRFDESDIEFVVNGKFLLQSYVEGTITDFSPILICYCKFVESVLRKLLINHKLIDKSASQDELVLGKLIKTLRDYCSVFNSNHTTFNNVIKKLNTFRYDYRNHAAHPEGVSKEEFDEAETILFKKGKTEGMSIVQFLHTYYHYSKR